MNHTLSLKRVYRVKLSRVMLTMAIKNKAQQRKHNREIRKNTLRFRSNFSIVHRAVRRVVRCGVFRGWFIFSTMTERPNNRDQISS